MPAPPLRPVPRQSLADRVFEQLRDRIVGGALAPGAALPAERSLCETLGVARGPLREALARLAQARLVSVRHGGGTVVLDFREHAGLGLLPDLVSGAPGETAPAVVAAVMEMRSALGPDVARLAALRGGDELAERLDAIVLQMEDAADELGALQLLALSFWTELVRACGNLAYQLAFNSMREVYVRSLPLLTDVLAEEFRDHARYVALAQAVGMGEPEDAESEARFLLRRGEARVSKALEDSGVSP